MRKFPPSMKQYETEGYVKYEKLRPFDCLFNSRFESGNLRQAFKVPKDHDFDMIPVDDEVPDYLPDELQQEKRIEIKEARIAALNARKSKHLKEEKEDEIEMNLPAEQRKLTYGGIFEENKKKKDKPAPVASTADKDAEKMNNDLDDIVNSDGEKEEKPNSDDEDEEAT